MTNLINKILDILNDIDGIQTVMFDNGHSANVRIDRKQTPAALLYTLPEWTLDISHGTAKERADIQVFFFERVKFDSTAETKLDIFENTNLLAREFVSILLSDSTVRVLDDEIKVTACYGEFDAMVAGCTINLELEMKQGECLYTEPIPEPTPEDDDNDNTQENEG